MVDDSKAAHNKSNELSMKQSTELKSDNNSEFPHAERPDSLDTQENSQEVKLGEQAKLDEVSNKNAKEVGGPKGLEPTRYGDWESKGRCYDF